MQTVIYTLIVSAVLALLLGFLLGFFKKIFYVPVDEKVAAIRTCLPGANCGGCGYPGCDGYAAAVAKGDAPVDGCSAGGAGTAKAVGKIMGVEANVSPKIAVAACRGAKDIAAIKGFYNGVKTCKAVKLAINGNKLCSFGCIGYGDCVSVCKFGAIAIAENGLPVVDGQKCTGCGMCAKACPQTILSVAGKEQKAVFVQCSNRAPKGPAIIKNCSAACIKCGICEKTCTHDAIHIQNNLPVVDYAKCDGCGDCAAKCPKKVLVLRNS
ncbi:MAG: RnfABCDGE type electron transport complex subunit B [Bacteroides sp.]|nr:RnfABCDGE type electron transport complex subunit B [Prevotella sp.]MCM1407729.1 RnfABCDGE type electron transport complex subunit B [Treponema brennaborense]MCM1469121.1 RnfABCDGE type electron transport complex subunit B [Bacteroides sp.]